MAFRLDRQAAVTASRADDDRRAVWLCRLVDGDRRVFARKLALPDRGFAVPERKRFRPDGLIVGQRNIREQRQDRDDRQISEHGFTSED